MELIATLVIGAALGGVAIAVIISRRPGVSVETAVQAAVRHAVDEVRATSIAERDQAVQAAVAHMATVSEQLSRSQAELAEHQRRLAEQHFDAKAQAIDVQVGTMNEQLSQVTSLVQSLDRQRTEKQGALEQALTALHATTSSLHKTLASPQARGQWGERTADDLLKALGFVPGLHYRKQATNASGTRPDFTFLLGDERIVNMDVKFPIDSYVKSLEATSETDRARHEQDFLKAVRGRIREITGRDYIDAAAGTVDHVLCFVPNESVYGFILQHGDDLITEALAAKVVLCSPMTLFAMLSVIRQGAELSAVERTSDEVLSLLGAFEKEWGKFGDAMSKVQRGFNTTARAFDDLSGTRRRALEKPLVDLDALRRQRGLPVAVGYETDPGVVELASRRASGTDDSW